MTPDPPPSIPVPPCDRWKIHSRAGHVVVLNGDLVLVWGGECLRGDHASSSAFNTHDIFVFDTGTLAWTRRRTTGDAPPPGTSFVAGHVVRGRLYVIGVAATTEEEESSDAVHVLDLVDWSWTRMDPAGARPLRCSEMCSWVSEGSIFIFGGCGRERVLSDGGDEGDSSDIITPPPPLFETELFSDGPGSFFLNNQLAAYNVEKNAWWWPPRGGGRVPSPRGGHAAIVGAGSKVYVFGGRLGEEEEDDVLHTLDMTTWSWEEDKSGQDADNRPRKRLGHSLTLLPSSQTTTSAATALLYGGGGGGGTGDCFLGDCWLLHLPKTLSPHRWTRCRDLEMGPRYDHAAVAVEGAGQVWLVGGQVRAKYDASGDAERILKLTLPPGLLSLRRLSLKALAGGKARLLPTTEVPGRWPPAVKTLFLAYVRLEEEEAREKDKEDRKMRSLTRRRRRKHRF